MSSEAGMLGEAVPPSDAVPPNDAVLPGGTGMSGEAVPPGEVGWYCSDSTLPLWSPYGKGPHAGLAAGMHRPGFLGNRR